MAFEELPTYALTFEGVREGAPEESGIYAIFTSTQWVFIGDADNVKQALFNLLNAPDKCVQSHHPLSFSFELVGRSERVAQRDALITNLRPVCNHPG